eukprot:1441778-Rhodomonas_salina.2
MSDQADGPRRGRGFLGPWRSRECGEMLSGVPHPRGARQCTAVFHGMRSVVARNVQRCLAKRRPFQRSDSLPLTPQLSHTRPSSLPPSPALPRPLQPFPNASVRSVRLSDLPAARSHGRCLAACPSYSVITT